MVLVTPRLSNPGSLQRYSGARSEDVEPTRPAGAGSASKAQQLTGFSWLVLSHGSLGHGSSPSKGCGSAGKDSPHSPRSCLKIKRYKNGFHLPISMEKYEDMKILMGMAVEGGCWCSPDPAPAGHAAMKAPFISR